MSARGPSRPRPWLAVAEAETAGDVTSGAGAHASATGSSREGHGSVTEVRAEASVRPPSNGQESAVFLGSVWPNFRTPQGSAWLEIRVWRGFPTEEIPDRSDLPLSRAEGSRKSDFVPSLRPSPSNPSRPGRLIAVTASQDRDETPRTPYDCRSGRDNAVPRRASPHPPTPPRIMRSGPLTILRSRVAPWCNGSTPRSGRGSRGSSPWGAVIRCRC